MENPASLEFLMFAFSFLGLVCNKQTYNDCIVCTGAHYLFSTPHVRGKSTGARLLSELIGFPPLPGSPPAP